LIWLVVIWTVLVVRILLAIGIVGGGRGMVVIVRWRWFGRGLVRFIGVQSWIRNCLIRLIWRGIRTIVVIAVEIGCGAGKSVVLLVSWWRVSVVVWRGRVGRLWIDGD
jgi:hypothetical protein